MGKVLEKHPNRGDTTTFMGFIINANRYKLVTYYKSATLMLLIMWCWWLDDGPSLMVTVFSCWWKNHNLVLMTFFVTSVILTLYWWLFQCDQSVTNIDVALIISLKHRNLSSVSGNNSCWGNHRKHLLNMKESWSSKNYSTKSSRKSNWLLFSLNMKNDFKTNQNQMTKSESWFSF